MKFPRLFLIFLLLLSSQLLFAQPGWFRLNSGTGTELNSIAPVNNNAWAVGNGGVIVRTTNNGINWYTQPSGTVNNLNYILFRPDTVGYIVGNAGTILRSTDFGNNWVLLTSGTSADLNAIWPLFDTLTVIAVGNGGVILKSTNRGASWVQKSSPVSVNLNNIISGFPMDLFIAGDAGKILSSFDLGETWSEQSSGTTSKLNSFSVINFWSFTSVVHAVGDNGVILKTTNSGFNWTSLTSGTNQNLHSIYAINISGDTLLYFIAAGANGTMLESINGDMWLNRGQFVPDNLNSIQLQTLNRGYAAGSNGTIIKSAGNYFYADSKFLDANTISTIFRNDGGFNNRRDSSLPGFEWPKASGKYARFASGLWLGAVVDGQTRVATSGFYNEYYSGYTDNNSIPQGRNDSNYRNYKLVYGSGGTDRQYWPNSQLGNSNQGAPVYFDTLSNSRKPLDFGSQTMFYSFTDSYPESHTDFYSGATSPLKADIKQLNFSLDVPGALGNTVFSQFTIINRSNSVWNNAYFTVFSDDDLGDGTDDKVGCDSSLSLGFTYNGGNSDPVYGTAPPAVGFVLLRGVLSFTGNVNDTMHICRNKQQVIVNRYRDLGMKVFNFTRNGNPVYHDPSNFTQSYNVMKGLYTDGSGIIHPSGYVTTLAYSGNPVTGTGWNAGSQDDYRMYVSTGPLNMNPGDTQVIVTAQVIARGNSYLNSITVLRSYVNEVRAFYRSCYTSTPIGIENQQGIVKGYSLWQNYPNPFNPVTIIKFDIPKEGNVTIKVFDILGREVFGKNEFQKAGSHEVTFDGTNLASGIYFYSIEAQTPAGVFKDTKKMLLVK